MERGEYRPGILDVDRREGSDQEENALDSSFDITGNLRAMLQRETKGRVNPAVWLRFKLKNMVKEAMRTQNGKEKSQFFIDAFNAYGILAYNAYDHFPEEERPRVAIDLRNWASEGVTLEDPRSQQLVETMAEATDIPYTPGQTRFELPHEVIETGL